MTPGRVISLNGTSSSGKSSIARALQEILEEPYLHVGIDTFSLMLPESYRLGGPEGARLVPAPGGGVRPVPGPVQRRMRLGMYHAVEALVRTGNNVILDDVINDPDAFRECVGLLWRDPGLFVGVHCPLAVLEERERARGSRTPGIARGMLEGAHAHGIYDLEIDTSLETAMECATRIKRRLEEGPEPTAFRRLQQAFAARQS